LRLILFRYSAGFKALAEAIADFPTLSQHSQFIFIPGPTDPWSSSTLPRPPIPDSFVEPIRAKVPKATFTSNPARLKYFDQEIVIFREDLMGRMLRNIVQIKDGTEGANMKRYVRVQSVSIGAASADNRSVSFQLVQTILDQTHLSPLPIQVRPTIWEWDHALRLYPMPTTVSGEKSPGSRFWTDPSISTPGDVGR
jgi:DNA polymerase epsilon subunit 2